ncbi:MAG: putative permease [Candidatus Midichloriaceae bacterium]|jgi:lipopolysaccharide export system permease protein|nr:putative permease [Candidatus Midichloriaceae bacterium]
MSYVCIPLALFFASIAAFASLEANNELVILKCSGISNMQLCRAMSGIIGLIVLVHLSISLYLLPKSYQGFKDIQQILKETIISAAFEEGVFNTKNDSITIYVDEKIDDFKYKGIFIYDLRNKDKPLTIMANYGVLVISNDGPGFVLTEGSHQVEDKLKNQINLGFFRSYNFGLKMNLNQNDSRSLDVNELFIHELFDPGDKTPRIRKQHIVHGIQRIIWPAFNVILAIIVITGMATNLSRRSSNFAKQIKICALGVALIAALLILNNLSLKHFAYIYVTMALVIVSTAASIFLCQKN